MVQAGVQGRAKRNEDKLRPSTARAGARAYAYAGSSWGLTLGGKRAPDVVDESFEASGEGELSLAGTRVQKRTEVKDRPGPVGQRLATEANVRPAE